MELADLQWKYINEGNAHIVLQVHGTDYVLRLIKLTEKTLDLDAIRSSVSFVNKVSLPLLGLAGWEENIVRIPEKQLEELIKQLQPLRPEKRRHKSTLSCYAIRTPNLSILSPSLVSNYCVEIKPKEGYMSTKFSEAKKCYYCLKQYWKLRYKQISSTSNYCPLDLFSGDRNRMKNALQNLLDNPQNNIKIFKDGTIVYDENTNRSNLMNFINEIEPFKNSVNYFLEFLIEILLNSKSSSTIVCNSTLPDLKINKVECNETNLLSKESFLFNLKYLQMLAKDYDFQNVSIEDSSEIVNKMLRKIQGKKWDLKLDEHKKLFLKYCDPLQLWLIAAVMRDCSIMISFTSSASDDHQQYIQINDEKIPYKLSVTDLEPKKIKSLKNRNKSEKELLELFGTV